ncbi:MAG: hypothetical protein ACRD3R_14615, partial [Terriglobales bacterium]
MLFHDLGSDGGVLGGSGHEGNVSFSHGEAKLATLLYAALDGPRGLLRLAILHLRGSGRRLHCSAMKSVIVGTAGHI